MFKNTLFIKIVLIFTLPALGMMYFSTILVYEKVLILNELKNAKLHIRYLKATEALLHTVQKERGYSSTYLTSNKFQNELYKQRSQTDLVYKEYVNFISMNQFDNAKLIYAIKNIQSDFYNLELLRLKVDEHSLNNFNVLLSYNKINENMLDSIVSIGPVKNATAFNKKLSAMVNLLVATENAGIERALTAMVIADENKISNEIYNYLVKLYTIQDINLNDFILKADILEVNKLNEFLTVGIENRVKSVRNKLRQKQGKITLSTEDWWELSTNRIDSLSKVHRYTTKEILNLTHKLQTNAHMAQIFSLVFLFVSFLTLISLFFVLKKIIFNEQRSYNKINKQQKIYDVLSKANNLLIKITDEKKLFDKLCSLIVNDAELAFGFIGKVDKNNNIDILSSEGLLKDYLINKVKSNNEKDKKEIGLAHKAYIQKQNVIIDNLYEDNSLLANISNRYQLQSAAALPIKKFNDTYAVLVLYSSSSKYFDKEIEILLNNLINDITHTLEKIDYEKTRLEQENELRVASYAFESHEPMIITDKDINIVKANKAFCEASGYSKEEILNRNPRIFKSARHDKSFYESMWSTISKDGSWTGEIYNRRKNLDITPFRSTITAIKNSDGEIMHYIAQYIDISEQKEKQKILEYQATHDSLTKLPNRLLLYDRIKQSLIKVARHNVAASLIFIDLDNFKIMNDTLGHEVGDELLIEVASKLTQTVREEDTVARIGGDEFIVVAASIGNNIEEARINMEILANKIKDSLNSITEISGHKNISTPSIGVTLFDDATIDVNEIIKQADTAMYRAKENGKNCIEFF